MWLLVQVFGEDELADRLLARLLDQQFVDLGLTLLAQLFPVHQGLDLCARLAANQPDDGVETVLLPGIDFFLGQPEAFIQDKEGLYDADGKDLSVEPLQKLVYAPMAKEVWAKMEKSSWIQDGDTNAPRTVYLFSDPNCPYCNMFWEQARPWVKAGKVQLRHIMVGIIREDSPGNSRSSNTFSIFCR